MYQENDKNCWEILAIDAVRDKKTIKRAYAKLLKTTRPDEDPEGFKLLHDAYTEALDYLKQDWYWDDYNNEDDFSDNENTQYDEDTSDVENSADNDNYIDAERSTYKDTPEQNTQANHTAENKELHDSNDVIAQENYLEALQDLLNDKEQRDKTAAWEGLLNDELLLNITFKKQVSFFIVEQLLAVIQHFNSYKGASLNGKFLHAETLEHLDHFFGWQSNFQHLEQHFSYQYYSELNHFFDSLVQNDNANTATAKQKDNSLSVVGGWIIMVLIFQGIRFCNGQLDEPQNIQFKQEVIEQHIEVDINGNGKISEHELIMYMEKLEQPEKFNEVASPSDLKTNKQTENK